MKIACIYHSVDLDGWMSAAIVKNWFITTCNKKSGQTKFLFGDNCVIAQADVLTFIGYNYGQSIPDLSEYNQIIMCDISFPIDVMEKLMLKYDYSDFIWIDHHISAIKEWDKVMIKREGKSDLLNRGMFGIRDTSFAACELTWKYFFPDQTMPEIVRLLGRYDCFGHKGTDEELKVLEFQYGARTFIKNYEDAYTMLVEELTERSSSIVDRLHLQGISIYQYLCTEAKQTYKNGFEIEFLESLTLEEREHKIYKFICINKERFNPINFGIDYHKDGYDGCACFHYSGTHWKFSIYNDNGLVDCSVIAQQFGGGGHQGASGFILNSLTQIGIK